MYKTLIQMFETTFLNYQDNMALRWHADKKGEYASITYGQLGKEIDALGTALISIGVFAKQHIALIADVSKEWSLTSYSLQMASCVDVPRGTDSTGKELAYIISHSESEIVFVANQNQITKIESELPGFNFKVKYYILLDNTAVSNTSNQFNLNDLLKKGFQIIEKNGEEYQELLKRRKAIQPDNLSTIIYTSGTTGEPKGVPLTQSNLVSQINNISTYIPLDLNREKESALTLLPPWHIFGRMAELFIFANGVSITYTDIKNIGDDLRELKPSIVPAVPRIWEGVYGKIVSNVRKNGKEGIFNFFKGIAIKHYKSLSLLKNREAYYIKPNFICHTSKKIGKLFSLFYTFPLNSLGRVLVFKKVLAATGGNLRFSISGGGALPSHIDDFFAAIGVRILEGYGLTETSPVLAIREPDSIQVRTVGRPLAQTQIKLIDLEGNDVTSIPGAKGTLFVKGPQVMSGYYKNPKKTEEAFKDGWFNTGDLVKITTKGFLSIVGRSKDTIVLLGGENVEPTPIEEKLKESRYIDHVMCVGQDQKTIGALIVPNEEALIEYAKTNAITETSVRELIKVDKINQLYRSEINSLVSVNTGFKPFEKVVQFALLEKPFEKGDELNNTLKVVRHVVYAKYDKLIQDIYKNS